MPQILLIWLQRGNITLHFTHKETILQGSMPNDVIINAAQLILKEQFSELLGFQSTLLLKKEQPRYQSEKVYIQIIFDWESHWIVASNALTKRGQIIVYNFIFNSIDKNTKEINENLFGPSVVPYSSESSKQSGGADCGLYAIGKMQQPWHLD